MITSLGIRHLAKESLCPETRQSGAGIHGALKICEAVPPSFIYVTCFHTHAILHGGVSVRIG